MTRDQEIEKKVESLNDIIKVYNERMKSTADYVYKTNLKVGEISLRTLTTTEDVYKQFKKIYSEQQSADAFNIEFDRNITPKFFGYTYADWVDDIRVLLNQIEVKKAITSIEDAIKKLKKFESAEKRENDAYSALLDSISDIECL